MFSIPLLGTDKNKTKMSWFDYVFTHLIPTWIKSFEDNFRMWSDLMTGNYAPYVLLKSDDPFETTYDWFWSSINLDETYPKEFLEYLMEMSEDVRTGKIETIPYSREMFEEDEEILKEYYEN